MWQPSCVCSEGCPLFVVKIEPHHPLFSIHGLNLLIRATDPSKMAAAVLHDIQRFWADASLKHIPSQLERYIAAGAPDYIQKFIAMGGGQKMGTTCEKFARFRFPPPKNPPANG